MRRIAVLGLFVATLALPAPAFSAAAETIGVVRRTTGTATITRGAQVLAAAPGTKLLAGDALGTGPDGTVGVILRDNSTLSLGPGSRLVIRSFLFAPAEGKLGLLVRVTRGTLAYVSGLIAKLSPASARFETPVATIGFRGTRFAVKVDEQ